ncbi:MULTISPECIES: cardiolipin synthase ClsB [Ramlibacter]|uniref:Cardiolipin synthase B n=1 Tax=Ramlibacter aquaticus TaxID=2780094 RepID=A0ABR9SG84_9BURK|nr:MULTISPECIES: cardiolipin synthase ClsB [Ramlibacter]MBE7941367.1 cardiolipin synthase ClsB [Ramlibacter aquaticus]
MAQRSQPPLRPGHTLRLLQGASEMVPAMVAAIDAAARLVRLESYIFDFLGEGLVLAQALERAAARGVAVNLVIDGFGSLPVPPEWQARFDAAGVQCRIYAPLGWLGVLSLGSWRRLHRKLCVVDSALAFCGGINVLDDLLDSDHRQLPAPRFDFSVEVRGPLVADVEATMSRLWLRLEAVRDVRGVEIKRALHALRASGVPPAELAPPPRPPEGSARAALVLRDNLRNRDSIERAYRRAIGHAREEVIISNAYFVPGRKMRSALVAAARRGVRVRLLLQGRYESFMQYYASRPVYGELLRAGVEIHEYAASFLHGKVAVVDGAWATVGSSNLDPLSLLLAREANVVVEDQAFAALLRERLVRAMETAGRVMSADGYSNRPLRERFMERIALFLMRLALVVQGQRYL